MPMAAGQSCCFRFLALGSIMCLRPLLPICCGCSWDELSLACVEHPIRQFDLQGSYRFDQSRQMDETASLPDGQPVVESGPTRYQTATIGVHLGRRLSAARRLSVSLSGGVTQLLSAGSASGEEFHPAVSLSFEFIPARMWALSMMASQQVTVMAGVSASPVDNKNFALTLNGTVLRRLHLAVTGNYMKGTTLAGTAMSHTAATGGNLGLQYGFKRSFGVYATYSYYHHRLENGLPTAAGIPPLYDRQSARVGFTLWLPLYGTF